MNIDNVLSELHGGRVFDLEQERYVGAPIYPDHWPGYVYTLHRHHEVVNGRPRTSASGTIIMQEHSGTHLDALCHQAVEMEMYGNVTVDPAVQTPRGFTELGIETVDPIIRRGVLIDVAASKGVSSLDEGYLITGDDLAEAASAQGTEIREGDCVFVRTGWGARFNEGEGYLKAAGVGASGAQWLADHHPFLCGADNVAFDTPTNMDPDLGSLPSHIILIVRAGIYILENAYLEELSNEKCYEFLFFCTPLKMRGVTGSPVRPLAIATK